MVHLHDNNVLKTEKFNVQMTTMQNNVYSHYFVKITTSSGQ